MAGLVDETCDRTPTDMVLDGPAQALAVPVWRDCGHLARTRLVVTAPERVSQRAITYGGGWSKPKAALCQQRLVLHRQ